jgi:hypothetical protein
MGLDSGILTPRLLGLMALTGRRQTEIFFSAKFSLPPKKNSPFPPLSSTASSKPLRLLPSPSWPSRKRSSAHSLNSGISKAFLPPMPSTRPPDLSYQNTFPTPSALWTSPGTGLPPAAPTPPSAATASNLRTRPTISSSPKS